MLNLFKNMLAGLLRGFAHMARKSGDLLKAAALEAQAAASEAVQPLVDRLPTSRRGWPSPGRDSPSRPTACWGSRAPSRGLSSRPESPPRRRLPTRPWRATIAAQAKPRAKGPTFGSHIQAAAGALLARDEAGSRS